MEHVVEVKETPPEIVVGEVELSPWKAYFHLWKYANPLDLFLRCLGAAGALRSSSAYPLITLIFRSLVNAFNNRAMRLMSPSDFCDKVNHNALWFVYLFIEKFSVSKCQSRDRAQA